ncbi:MAG: glycosyltransferase family 4 protein [Bacteroidota bacterium]
MEQKKSIKVLFFYSELAAYFLACAEKLYQEYGVEIHIVHWPINPEAPFNFRTYEGVYLYPKANYDREGLFALYQQLSPSLLFTAGWMDADYKFLAKKIRKEGIPVIVGLDNHWKGNLRQQLASLISPFYLKPNYSHVWVPGDPQYTFARKLGYKEDKILKGFYSADLAPFMQAYERIKEEKKEKYPHRFLYVGRFVEVKGISLLVEAFQDLSKEMEHDWELELVGTGPLKAAFEGSTRIHIRDFVQPERLPELAQNSGCFVLPSLHEPWGVVLHEFAGAGLPLISSSSCGAATAFLEHGRNGFAYEHHNQNQIKACLKHIIEMSDEDLCKMSLESYKISQKISPESWSKTLYSLIA